MKKPPLVSSLTTILPKPPDQTHNPKEARLTQLNEAERRAITLLAQAWNALLEAVPDAQQRREACADIHRLQHLVMAQPTIRSEPDFLRQPERQTDAN